MERIYSGMGKRRLIVGLGIVLFATGGLEPARAESMATHSMDVAASPSPDGTDGLGEPYGYDPGDTLDAGDPVSAAGGEFRQAWDLLDLGGLAPIRISLVYAPDLRYRSPYNEGRTQFPPWENNSAFTTDSVARIVQFLRKSDNKRFVNVFVGNDALVFAEITPDGFQAVGPVKYQLIKSVTGYFYFMDPRDGQVIIFRSRAWGMDSGAQIVERAGEATQISDRNGNRISFTYNADNNPTLIADDHGRTLTLEYLAGGLFDRHLSRITDAYGRSVSFNYQSPTCSLITRTVLQSYVDAMGRTTSFEYFNPPGTDCTLLKKYTRPNGNAPLDQAWKPNADGRPAIDTQDDAYGNRTSFSYALDGFGNAVTTVTHPDTSQRLFTHQRARYPLALTDESGQSAAIGLNTDNQIATLTDRLGDTTTLTYHPETGLVASLKNVDNKTVTNTYTAQDQAFINPANAESFSFTFHNLTRVDYPDGTLEAVAYDARGNPTSRVDRAGKTWTYTYDAHGQPLTETNPTGGTRTYTYNADTTLASVIDGDGVSLTYAYDANRRPIRVTHADGTFAETTYNDNDEVLTLKDEKGATYSFVYDANGNVTGMTDPLGYTFQYAYDLMDRLVSVTDRLGKVSNITYDNRGRVASVTDANGLVTSFAYDNRGWRTGVTRGGKTWRTAYDDEGLPVSHTRPSGKATTYVSNKLGLLSTIGNPLGQSSTLAWDAMLRKTGVTDPLGHSITATYEARGLPASVSLPGLGAASYAYDNLGRLSGITDLKGGVWTFAHTGMGRRLSLTDPNGQVWSRVHDNRGRPSVLTYPGGATETRTYDNAGNPTRKLHSVGPDLTYAWDALNRLATSDGIGLARDKEGRITSTDNAGVAYGATYDDGGRLTSVLYNNGAFTVNYAYDAVTGRLSGVSDSLAGATVGFSHDDDGNLTGITRSNGVNTVITRDGAGRLARKQDGTVLDITYTRDAAGNLTGVNTTAPLDPLDYLLSETRDYGYDAASQTGTAGYVHDARGRLTATPGYSYAWDGASRLVGINGVALGYNGLDDLVTRATTRFHYNKAIGESPIVAEQDGTTSLFLRYYVWTPGGRLLYMIDATQANKVYFHHFDKSGTTLALTDATGVVTDSYAYTPQGRLLRHEGANPQPFTFVGERGVRQEGNAGDHYQMRARYYDARIGRFLSREPVWPNLADPHQINPYQYALNSPLNHVDVNGLSPPAPLNDLWKVRKGNRWELLNPEPSESGLGASMGAAGIAGLAGLREFTGKFPQTIGPVPGGNAGRGKGRGGSIQGGGAESEVVSCPPPEPPPQQTPDQRVEEAAKEKVKEAVEDKVKEKAQESLMKRIWKPAAKVIGKVASKANVVGTLADGAQSAKQIYDWATAEQGAAAEDMAKSLSYDTVQYVEGSEVGRECVRGVGGIISWIYGD